jgi:hypothetical protein
VIVVVEVFSKNVQTIVNEITDYSKKSFEEGTKAFEQLLGAKSLDKAMEIQQVTSRTPTRVLSPNRPKSAGSMQTSPKKPTSQYKVT